MSTPELHKKGLVRRLLVGKFLIKEGHNVKKLNPDGKEVIVPLGGNQIEERIITLVRMIKRKELSSTSEEVSAIKERYPQYDYLFK